VSLTHRFTWPQARSAIADSCVLAVACLATYEVVTGLSALAVTLIGRTGDAVTAGVTTAVVLVVAAVSPRDAWVQPILRLADTLVGVAVGVAAAWIGLRLIRPRLDRGDG
jgi:uncharacterized membrane protein YccC